MTPGADEVVVPVFDDDTYPRLLRTARSRWWRPALGLFIAAVTVVLAAVAVILVALLVSWLTGGQGDPTAQDALNADTPLGLLANNLVIATMIPAAVLAVLVAHRDRPGWLASVTGRLRWGLLWRLLPIGLLVVLVSFGLGFLLPTSNDTSTSVPSVGTLITLLAVIVVSTPLQAAAEEVGFRGYLTQAVSSWFARPAVGVLVGCGVSSVCFALAHGVQDGWLFGDRLAFGLVACWLAWRTGGLEASVALHAANNLVSLTFTAATGSLADSLTASTLEWQFAALDLVMMLTYAVLVDRLTRRWRPVTRRVLSPAAGVGYPGSRPITSPPARG
jgi:membrane protease YdiL (CAAX protease family)